MIDHSKSKVRQLFLELVVEAHREDKNCKPYEFKIFQSTGDKLSGKLERFDGRNLGMNVFNKAEGHQYETIPVVLFSEQVSTISLENSALISKITKALSIELDAEERFTDSVLCEHMLKPLMNKQNLTMPLSQRKMSYIYVSSLNTGSLKFVGNVLACDDDFLILHSERSVSANGGGEKMIQQLQLINMNDISTIETGLLDMGQTRSSPRRPQYQANY